MILSTHGIVQSSGGFDVDYQAILNYATTQGYTLPSSSQRVKQNKLLVDLKAAGVWNKLDTLAIFATDGNSDFALIDWKRLSQYTAINSPTFISNGGFTGNGTSSYVDTNFNCLSNGVNYQGANAGRFFWADNRVNAGPFDGTSANNRNNSFNENALRIRMNSGFTTLSVAVPFDVDEYHAINRISTTQLEIFTNTTQYSRTQAGGASDGLMSILRTGTFFLNARMRFYALGSSLVSENNAFYNAMNTYFTSL